MQIVQFEGTELRVSRLCLGVMTFGGQVDEGNSVRITNRALDLGINFFDAANVYAKGQSEILLGKALGARRKDVVVASKARGVLGDPPQGGLSRQAIFKAVEESLRRLNTDFLDIYYMHWPDDAVPIGESLEAMDRLVRDGKVRYLGSSNYSGWQVTEQHWLCDKNGWQPPRITQPMYNLLARGIEQEYLPMAKRLGVSTVVYNPLAGGLLTGKQSREAPAEGTRFHNNQLYLDRYWHPAYFEAVEELKRAGRGLISLALNWLLHHTQADCAILGASRLEQLEANVAAAEEGPLSPEELAVCDAVWAKLRGVTPKYNR